MTDFIVVSRFKSDQYFMQVEIGDEIDFVCPSYSTNYDEKMPRPFDESELEHYIIYQVGPFNT